MVNKINTTDLDPIVGDKGEILILNGYLDKNDKNIFHANARVLEVYSDKQNDVMLCEITRGYWIDSNGDAIDTSENTYVAIWCRGNVIVSSSDIEYDVTRARELFFNMAETC